MMTINFMDGNISMFVQLLEGAHCNSLLPTSKNHVQNKVV